MNSIIIIGKGSSVGRCTKEFVDSHDEVAIINHIVYGGYEHLISNHADYIFCNRSGFRYNESMVQSLGLKEAIFTGKDNQRFDKNISPVKFIYPKPNLGNHIIEEFDVDPSSGMQGVYYLINQKKYNKISLVGFDFYEVGSTPYYFKPEEAPSDVKYLWGGKWRGNKINIPSGHDTDKSIEMLLGLMGDNKDIEFEMITNNSILKETQLENLKIWVE
tara:strand:- start:52906 stop:53556 length:651 start_codon:yes stop_codon:yes gene_type:complete